MSVLYPMIWLVGLLVSIYLIFETVGTKTMVQFFPEGRRPWMLPAQYASLAFFAVVVLNHPFGS